MGNYKHIYKNRPFKTRNADQYKLGDVLSLFIPPSAGTKSDVKDPFSVENVIIRGKMGSGKTMFLRANYAYYLHALIPALTNGIKVTLPVFIKLNDFQHLEDPKEIYSGLILRIVEGICNTYLDLSRATRLAALHDSFRQIRDDYFRGNALKQQLLKLKKLSADEYKEHITKEIKAEGGIVSEFFKASGELKKSILLEIKDKSNPSIMDIQRCYEALFEDYEADIVLLMDEAGSLSKDFFIGKSGDSMFEVFMNQCRTSQVLYTKIAVYPNSFQDILREIRYGDVVNLEDEVEEFEGYTDFRYKTENLIWTYLNHFEEEMDLDAYDIFEGSIEDDFGDPIEQAINASGGNMRRLIQILDSSMNCAFERHFGEGKVSLGDVNSALRKSASGMLKMYDTAERSFLKELSSACKSRSTYRFRFPNQSVELTKYTKKTSEQNILNLVRSGRGKKGFVYELDYSYCVLTDVPTHSHVDSDRICRARSFSEGKWIQKVTSLSREIIAHAGIESKIEGKIILKKNEHGLIRGVDGKDYLFLEECIIQDCKGENFYQNRKVRFSPMYLNDRDFAGNVETL